VGAPKEEWTRLYKNIFRVQPDRLVAKALDEVLVIAEEQHLVIVRLR